MTTAMKVLVVDDHPYELNKFAAFVKDLGYEVITAVGFTEATRILMPIDDSLTPSISAIVTDTRMGEHSGINLLQFVWRNDPPPCLLHSSDPTFRLHGDEIDLAEDIPQIFPFAQFHLKGEDLTYIKEFLAKLA
jgi:DNA-binding NtrC family response regulator